MPKQAALLTALLCCMLLSAGCQSTQDPGMITCPVNQPTYPVISQNDSDDDGFVSLFNGQDLTGWTPKFVGHELGVNHNDTFRVEDGCITVNYSNWENFGGTFGHLFYETEYSHYILRLEYRFIGEQCPGGPGWAFRNSGVMFHGTSADSMGLNQNFPDSIEAQLLGQAEDDPRPRPTGNVCSPGTHYYQGGEMVRAHCQSSTSDTFRGDQWVTFEIEVHGHGTIIHRVNGEVVFEYERPILSGGDIENPELSGGSISLQAESHPCQFRNIEIRVLEPEGE